MDLFRRRKPPPAYAHANPTEVPLSEQLAAMRKQAERSERDANAMVYQLKHVFQADNYLGAEWNGDVLTVTHKY